MPDPWQVQVYEQQQLVFTADCSAPVEFGRQAEGEGAPYLKKIEGGRCRIIMARLDEKVVSRKHLAAEPLPDGRVRLTNLSRNVPVRFADGSELEPTGSRDLPMPAVFIVGERRLRIQSVGAPAGPAPTVSPPHLQTQPPLRPEAPAAPMHSLLEATIPPNREIAKRKSRAISAPEAAGGMQLEALVRWLQAAMAVLQSAAGSTDFFDQAAGALVEMVGLESGQVLLLDKGQWKVQALHTAPRILMGADRQPSRQVLHRVQTEKRTFWQVPSTGPEGGSLLGVNALVAAPILDPKGEVIGALYGDRGQSGGFHTFRPITKLEAMLVELLAGGVAAGLARLEQEQAALESQKKFLKVERDLEIGRKIQIGFLPEELPQPAGWEIGAYFKPAREVSGDFYDVFPISDCHQVLVIADVCDKGVGAALFMALFRTLIRAFSQQTLLRGFLSLPAAKQSRDSRTEGRRLNNLLVDLNVLATVELTNHYVTSIHGKAFMFVTLFIGILDTTTGTLVYVNAGHDSPAILGPKGVKKRLPPTGPVVGLMPDSAYNLDKLQFEKGDILFAYTDGVTDARDPAGQLFTEKRLLTVLEQPAPTAPALLDRIVANLQTHIASADPFDDITMLAVRWTV